MNYLHNCKFNSDFRVIVILFFCALVLSFKPIFANEATSPPPSELCATSITNQDNALIKLEMNLAEANVLLKKGETSPSMSDNLKRLANLIYAQSNKKQSTPPIILEAFRVAHLLNQEKSSEYKKWEVVEAPPETATWNNFSKHDYIQEAKVISVERSLTLNGNSVETLYGYILALKLDETDERSEHLYHQLHYYVQSVIKSSPRKQKNAYVRRHEFKNELIKKVRESFGGYDSYLVHVYHEEPDSSMIRTPLNLYVDQKSGANPEHLIDFISLVTNGRDLVSVVGRYGSAGR